MVYKEDSAGKAAFNKRVDLELFARMETAASYAEGRVKDKLSEAGSGKTYKIGGKFHTASAPGEPPTVLTGDLRGSITHFVGVVGRDIIGIVSTNMEYAPALEFGTRKMAPRPFMRKAVLEALPVIWRIIKGVG
jgi:HK97 gp10 family phage protein